ncbi:MAG: hypothetical protein ACI9JL_003730 [Paracoccaceae bacterium]
MQGTYEARAENAHFQGADPDQVIKNCIHWLSDEPFSTRPALLGSYTAAGHLADYDLALKFVDIALISNPQAVELKNNKIVALARLAKVKEARLMLNSISEKERRNNPVLRATEGLVNFREGNDEIGRNLYRTTINEATGAGNKALAIRAEAHLLEEEIEAGNLSQLENMPNIKNAFESTKDAQLIRLWNEIEKT